jgi:hypothetical protein
MAERITFTPPPPRPVVVTLGCRDQLLDRCRRAAARIPADLEPSDLLTVAGRVASIHPLAVLIAVDVYAFDPEELDALARSVGAHRLLVDEHEPIDRLAARLGEAVRERSAIRTRDSVRPPPRSVAPRSGIRWAATGQDLPVAKVASRRDHPPA